ncbi:MAG: glutamate-5-semialdehyde dehydrogenase [Spirochaetia bacterium]|jgi:glutamate-5-semialdehyde dehydrogenase|nr:glutamate-5-semialdehyde dehydrogenase [Spirochaetia bacterium]
MDLAAQLKSVRQASQKLASSSLEERNQALRLIAAGLKRDKVSLFAANEQDVAQAEKNHVAPALLGRLHFDEKKLQSVLSGLEMVATLPDPIGKVLQRRKLDDSLLLEKVAFPLGVIGMIFEARPDALVQIVSLALKSGNGIVLKGGREADKSNTALVASIKKSLEETSFGSDWLLLIHSREETRRLFDMEGLIDLLIPRGSNTFVRYVMENTKIPVMGHSQGLCSIYVDDSCDIEQAVAVCVDAKVQYPSACNAVETLLVNRKIASVFLPLLKKQLETYGVIIHGDETCRRLIDCVPATDEDWDTEYLALEVAIKVVNSVEEAMEHIARHGSHHTDAILAEDETKQKLFLTQVDSADVFVNCSTRFADGYRFGLGAEVGISTSKLHARGPVGMEGLMTTKYLLKGSGNIVDSYSNGTSHFTHEELSLDGKAMNR